MDPEAIHQCLLNLVANALDACLDEAVADQNHSVTVSVDSIAGGGVEYKVADTGPGIPESIRGNIFQSFFSTKGTEGTGIGLMLCKKIVDRHGGSIDVASEPNKGSTFIVRLPAAPE
jgi:signal transduction histidine kinase